MASQKFIIVKDVTRKIRRFEFTGRTLEFRIKPVPFGEEPISWIRDAITQVIHKSTEGLLPNDLVGFTFCSEDFKKGDGWIRFRPAQDVNINDIWNMISSIYQSNSAAFNTETFCLGVTSVRLPTGKGNERRNKYNSFNEECLMRRGIVTIDNKDNLCLPRALVVSMAHVEKSNLYKKLRKNTGKLQTLQANELIKTSNVFIPETGAGIPELEKFQEHLQEYKIVVYSHGSKGRDIIFTGDSQSKKMLNLIYHEGHFNVITSLTAAFCCSYYCEDCHTPYNTKNTHRCTTTCPSCCQSPACHTTESNIKCESCNRMFRGMQCFDNHLRPGTMGKETVCLKIRRCGLCFKTIKSDREHTCGEIFCKTCFSHVPEPHYCFIQVDTRKPKTQDTLFIFYDLETAQEEVLNDGNNLHQPVLCVFKQYCDACLSSDNNFCVKCGIRKHILKNNPVERFMEFLLNQRKFFKKIITVAHNGQAFDHQFQLNYILTQSNLKPDLIMRGTKIIRMQIDNIIFLDSLNYFPMALSELPKAFGFSEKVKKGWFPIHFIKTENMKYVGPLPDLKYFDPDRFSEKERSSFIEWYEKNRADGYVFDFQKEIVDYCVSDVEILATACIEFRKQLLTTVNVCPFTEATTIASACNKVFRRNFLSPNTIGIIPKRGYRSANIQSKVAIQWLLTQEKELGINILHALKQNEKIIGGVKVDGFCSETKQVFEFHGCWYHGCPKCFKFNRDKSFPNNSNDTLNARYESTLMKTERLKNLGYEVLETWECVFRNKLREDKELREYIESHPLLLVLPLNPRDAFFGGRTENIYEYYKIKDNEKIRYVDVCSLYPWVCKYGKFPVGHPKVYVGEECSTLDLKGISGLIKCRVLPNCTLFHPILPAKINDKLLFVSCRTCGEKFSSEKCTHSEEERAITGTWIVEELLKAVENGYQLLETHEIWSYKIQQFNKTTGTPGLFTDMMNKFIKIKQQASGWPENCTTEEEKERYIEEFFEREDVKLEYSEILKNDGLRSLAKLILNSFWGKFGQRERQPRTKIVNKPEELFDIVCNPSIIICNLFPVNDTTIIVNYEEREEAYVELSTVNVAIASYVTAQARLKLYEYLEALGERVLYFDTDSVVYISRPGEYEVTTGKFIGDMTDELENFGCGSYITEFVSGGPKNYAYKVYSPVTGEENVISKVKGISLNYAASQVVNFESIKNMVLKRSEPISILSSNIRRTRNHEVVTVEETKLYRSLSNKRKFFDDFTSLPYGYKKKKCE